MACSLSAAFTGLAAIATSAGVAITCIAVSMFFMQFGITCKWILVTAVTPQAYSASAASNQNFAGFLGGTLSPILTGFIVDVTGSFVLALAIGAIITLIGAALFQFAMTTVIDEVETGEVRARARLIKRRPDHAPTDPDHAPAWSRADRSGTG